MAALGQYAIRGGAAGRERLRLLARITFPGTASLLDTIGIAEWQRCLDVGCGGGDVTVEFARRIGPRGRIIGVDIDEELVDIARREAEAQGIRNAEFRWLDIRTAANGFDSYFDIVYARFLLTHLAGPSQAIAAFYRYLRPGGHIIVEDIDFSGHFTYPNCEAFRRYLELYSAIVRSRGGDPDIGPRLPVLLTGCGVEAIAMNVVQPIGTTGEVKLMTPVRLENIADAVIEDGLASRQEIGALIRELHQFAENPRTVAGLPRIVQAWGRRAGR